MRVTIPACALLYVLTALSVQAQTLCDMPAFAGRESLGQQCWQASEVSGSVLGVDVSRGTIHISLSALSSNEFVAAEVDETGSFVLHSVPAGDYRLLVTQGGRFVGVADVTVSPVTSLLIFQVSNDRQILRPGAVSPDFDCVRSLCYFHPGGATGQ